MTQFYTQAMMKRKDNPTIFRRKFSQTRLRQKGQRSTEWFNINKLIKLYIYLSFINFYWWFDFKYSIKSVFKK